MRTSIMTAAVLLAALAAPARGALSAADSDARLRQRRDQEDEVVAARPTAGYDAKFGVNERAIGNFLRVVYRSLPH